MNFYGDLIFRITCFKTNISIIFQFNTVDNVLIQIPLFIN